MPPKRNLRRGLYKEKTKAEKQQQKELDTVLDTLKNVMFDLICLTGERNAAIWTLRALQGGMDLHYYAGTIDYEDGEGVEQLTADSVPEHANITKQAGMLVAAAESSTPFALSEGGLLYSQHARLIFQRLVGPEANLARRITALNVLERNEELLAGFRELCNMSELLESTTEEIGENLDQLTAAFQELFDAAMEQPSGARIANVMAQENPLLSEVSYVNAPASVFGLPVVENSNVPPETIIGIDYASIEDRVMSYAVRSRPPTFEDTVYGPILNLVYETRDIASDPDIWVQSYTLTVVDESGMRRDCYSMIRKTNESIRNELISRQINYSGPSLSPWIGGHLNNMMITSFTFESHTSYSVETTYTIDCTVHTSNDEEISYARIPITAITHIDRRGIRMVGFDLTPFEVNRIRF